MVYQTTDLKNPTQTLINLWDIDANENIGKDITGSNPFFSPDNLILVYQTTNPDTGQTFINLRSIAGAKNIGKDINGSYLNIVCANQTLIYQTTDPDTCKSVIKYWDITTGENIGEPIAGNYLALILRVKPWHIKLPTVKQVKRQLY